MVALLKEISAQASGIGVTVLVVLLAAHLPHFIFLAMDGIKIVAKNVI